MLLEIFNLNSKKISFRLKEFLHVVNLLLRAKNYKYLVQFGNGVKPPTNLFKIKTFRRTNNTYSLMYNVKSEIYAIKILIFKLKKKMILKL